MKCGRTVPLDSLIERTIELRPEGYVGLCIECVPMDLDQEEGQYLSEGWEESTLAGYELAQHLEETGDTEAAARIFSYFAADDPENKLGDELLEWTEKIRSAFQGLQGRLALTEEKEVRRALERSQKVSVEDRRNEFRVCVLMLKRAARILKKASRDL